MKGLDCQSLSNINAPFKANLVDFRRSVSPFPRDAATFHAKKDPPRESTRGGYALVPAKLVASGRLVRCSGGLARRCLGCVALGDESLPACAARPGHHGVILGCGFDDVLDKACVGLHCLILGLYFRVAALA